MTTNNNNVKMTSKGQWIVGEYSRPAQNPQRYIAVLSADKPTKAIALCGISHAHDQNESIANAALIASAPEMLDTLIAIQETMMTTPAEEFTEADMTAIAEMISNVFAKLANEAGEEL